MPTGCSDATWGGGSQAPLPLSCLWLLHSDGPQTAVTQSSSSQTRRTIWIPGAAFQTRVSGPQPKNRNFFLKPLKWFLGSAKFTDHRKGGGPQRGSREAWVRDLALWPPEDLRQMAPCRWTSAPLSAKRGFGLDDRRPFPALKCWSKVQRHKVRRGERDKSQSHKKSCKTDSFRDVGSRNGRFGENGKTITSWPGEGFHRQVKSSHLFSHFQEGERNSPARHTGVQVSLFQCNWHLFFQQKGEFKVLNSDLFL